MKISVENAVNVLKKLGIAGEGVAKSTSGSKTATIIAPKLSTDSLESPWKVFIADKELGVFVLPENGLNGQINSDFVPPVSSGATLH